MGEDKGVWKCQIVLGRLIKTDKNLSCGFTVKLLLNDITQGSVLSVVSKKRVSLTRTTAKFGCGVFTCHSS